MRKHKINKTSGITLIALVVTIIVLLLLAGISIQMLTGDNGVLIRAGQATEQTEEKQIAEKVKLSYLSALTRGRGQATEQLLKDELDKEFGQNKYKLSEDLTKVIIDKKEYDLGGTVVAESREKIIKDINGTTIAKIDGETEPWLPTSKAEILNNNIDTGLTIKDEAQNEWVWIEVPMTGGEEGVYKTAGIGITTFTDTEYLMIAQDLRNYSNSALENTSLSDHIPQIDKIGSDYTNIYKDVLKSIYQNGGFWIGRYETGIKGTEENVNSARIGEDFSTEYSIAENIPVIKANVQPYNWVNIIQAQDLSQMISTGTNKTSLLIGVQWDLVLKFIDEKDKNTNPYIDSTNWGNCSNAEFILNRGKYAKLEEGWKISSIWNEYDDISKNNNEYVLNKQKQKNTTWNEYIKYRILCTTGASDTNCKQNIYDLAGNLYEWVLENSTLGGVTYYRGGGFDTTGTEGTARTSQPGFMSYSHYTIGFRVCMY